jgi:hypothetical protein
MKAKYYNAQKSVIFHSGPDSIAMHSLTTQWCFSQSSKMMMNALLVHHIWQIKLEFDCILRPSGALGKPYSAISEYWPLIG